MLKIVEVVVLIGAGIGFAVWQFRDLRRAREITRQHDEAKQAQVVNASAESREPPLDGGSRDR
jgi:uncharacterized membrane protein